MTARPSGPSSTRKPPVGWNGSAAPRSTLASPDSSGAGAPGDFAVGVEMRLDRVVGEPLAPDRPRVAVQRGRRRRVRGSGRPCRRRRGNGSRPPCRWDRCGSAAASPRRGRRNPPRSARCPPPPPWRSRWMVRLVEPPVACRPTTPLTTARSSMTWPIGVKSLPSAVSSSARLTPSIGQRVAQRRVRD